MAPRRRSQKRSTKRGRKGIRKSMKGGKNWCCNGNSCNEQGWAPTCSPGNAKYVCDDNVTSGNVTTVCRQAAVSFVANGTGIAARDIVLTALGQKGGKRKTNKRRR